jgi:hypothetical protein
MARDQYEDEEDEDLGDSFASDLRAELAASGVVDDATAGAEEVFRPDPSEPDPSEPDPRELASEPDARPAAESFSDALRAEIQHAEQAGHLADQWAGVKGHLSELGRGYGIGKAETVARLVAAHNALARDPASAVAILARDWAGADPSYKIAIMNNMAAAMGIQGIDPRVAAGLDIERRAQAAAHQTYAALEQQAREQLDRQAAERAAEQIKTFAAGKSDFEAVRLTMGHIMAAGQANTLPEAYQKARMVHYGQVQQQPAMTAQQARSAALAKAKRASTPRTANYGYAAEPDPALRGTFGDALRAEFAARGVR